MQTYFSTFVTGAAPLVEKALKKRPLDKIKIEKILDGFVVYTSKYSERELRNIRFFNNTFQLLGTFAIRDQKNPIEEMFNVVLSSNKEIGQIKKLLSPGTTFKIVTSVGNQTISTDRKLLVRVENEIQQKCRLKLNIERSEKELWFVARSDHVGFFGIRITYPRRGEKKLQRGALRPELASIMSIASQPTPNDVVLDMFAGHGSIPLERAAAYPYKKILAVEKDKNLVKELRNRTGRMKRGIEVLEDDALTLNKVPDGSIDKIITDPPWGLYKQAKIPITDFYEKIVEQICKKLKSGGLAVVLTAAKKELENVVTDQENISMKQKHDILVSGKKAAIYILQKK